MHLDLKGFEWRWLRPGVLLLCDHNVALARVEGTRWYINDPDGPEGTAVSFEEAKRAAEAALQLPEVS